MAVMGGFGGRLKQITRSSLFFNIFCRCGGIDPYFTDVMKKDLEKIDLDFGGKWTTKKERFSCLLIWVQRLKNCLAA